MRYNKKRSKSHSEDASRLDVPKSGPNQGPGMGLQTGGTRDHFTHPCSTHQGGCFGAKKKKIDRGNPKLEHGQRLVNDQTCLNK